MKYHLELHAIVDANISVKEGHRLAHNLEDALRKERPDFGRILIHIEPNDYN
jgi:divalent metal cation (Fe/Co/Zn/Cd) transporter